MAIAREQIVRDIRRTLPADAPLPSLSGNWIQYANPYQQFLEVLMGVGGAGQVVTDTEALRTKLDALIARVGAKHTCSAFPEIVKSDVDFAAIDDPHQLARVDLAILPGELAVAENAAVWVTTAVVPQRVAYFLSQHVALIVPQDRIVNNMHEAYDWLHTQAGQRKPFEEPRWGTFMSGPSKTADIEQSLVIGAHGARSLNVFFI
jgi:L-lactate dehydrogenase complex protein LldG